VETNQKKKKKKKGVGELRGTTTVVQAKILHLRMRRPAREKSEKKKNCKIGINRRGVRGRGGGMREGGIKEAEAV